MKNMIIRFIVGIAGLSSCTPNNTEIISIIVDVTEFDANEIEFEKDGIGSPNDLWSGSIVRYSTITDVDYNEQIELKIDPANELLSNKQNREAELTLFKVDLQNLKHQDTLEYSGSSIWLPLINELSYLAQDSTKPTTVYLISDLMEHSSLINFYDKRIIKTLERDPERIKTEFQSKILELKQISHLKLIVIHQPKNAKENGVFKLILNGVYKPIMHDLGIEISVQAKF